MDLMTGAGAFATIVGLLSNFKSERSSADLEQFIVWLQERHHENVVDVISSNQAVIKQLREILSTNHDELIERLGALDQILSSVAIYVEGFSELARAMSPQSLISEQAVSVLKQLVNSGAKLFVEHKITSGEPDEYLLVEGGYGRIQYEEPRFMEDDLNTLVKLGLLRLEFASLGSRRFFVTREAVRFVSSMNR